MRDLSPGLGPCEGREVWCVQCGWVLDAGDCHLVVVGGRLALLSCGEDALAFEGRRRCSKIMGKFVLNVARSLDSL